jgi:hypothetical protein
MMQETIHLCDGKLNTVREQTIEHDGSKSDRAYSLIKAMYRHQGPIGFQGPSGDWIFARPDEVNLPKARAA